jgi:hypothetical protein
VRKIAYIFREMLHTIRRHKAHYFAPILLILAVLSILVYFVGPTAFVTFLYAGF